MGDQGEVGIVEVGEGDERDFCLVQLKRICEVEGDEIAQGAV